jgi:hypothetical protein
MIVNDTMLETNATTNNSMQKAKDRQRERNKE